MCAIFPGATAAHHTPTDCHAQTLADTAALIAFPHEPNADHWASARQEMGTPVVPRTVAERALTLVRRSRQTLLAAAADAPALAPR